MRRLGDLFDGVVSYSNLYRAYRKALVGARRNEEQARFYYNLEWELVSLGRELVYGKYIPGAYRYFMIHDPKEREIAIAPFRDRVVHHAIVNVVDINSKIRKTPVENVKKHREKLWTNI